MFQFPKVCTAVTFSLCLLSQKTYSPLNTFKGREMLHFLRTYTLGYIALTANNVLEYNNLCLTSNIHFCDKI